MSTIGQYKYSWKLRVPKQFNRRLKEPESARLAQSVERQTLNLKAVGSTPTLGEEQWALWVSSLIAHSRRIMQIGTHSPSTAHSRQTATTQHYNHQGTTATTLFGSSANHPAETETQLDNTTQSHLETESSNRKRGSKELKDVHQLVKKEDADKQGTMSNQETDAGSTSNTERLQKSSTASGQSIASSTATVKGRHPCIVLPTEV
ncbi:hypothetical protein BGX33_002634 [Mortierella sp. NVP41]|nr:hypothetical protein BGX33_002634 [Mortierella sp. NVP41]